MPTSEDLRRASSLYRAFREETPRRVRRVTVDLPRAAAVMGHVELIGYMTTHRGRTHLYLHEFAAGSRPLLVAGKGKGQLYMLLGRFKVTGRGITDTDVRGRIVHARKRYKVIKMRD
jgi:hypothetical protein